MTSPQLALADVVGAEEVGQSALIERDTQLRALPAENFRKLLHCRVREVDLVRDTTEKGFVDEVGRLQVRREDDESLEGNLDLLTGV